VAPAGDGPHLRAGEGVELLDCAIGQASNEIRPPEVGLHQARVAVDCVPGRADLGNGGLCSWPGASGGSSLFFPMGSARHGRAHMLHTGNTLGEFPGVGFLGLGCRI
jgi:hypothetical protein